MYWALYEFQGGKCYVCQVATGKKRRLAVDHEHNKRVVIIRPSRAVYDVFVDWLVALAIRVC